MHNLTPGSLIGSALHPPPKLDFAGKNLHVSDLNLMRLHLMGNARFGRHNPVSQTESRDGLRLETHLTEPRSM